MAGTAPIPAEELRAAVDAVRATAEWVGVPVTELGTTGGDTLAVAGLPDLPLAELRAVWTATLPALFGNPEVSVGSVPAGTVPTS